MISSLFAGISGLNANATAMTIIGDNIANVNTIAYKADDGRCRYPAQVCHRFRIDQSLDGFPDDDGGAEGVRAAVPDIEQHPGPVVDRRCRRQRFGD